VTASRPNKIRAVAFARPCRTGKRQGSEGALSSAVLRGQKRVEDARKRAYDPRIHRKKRFAQRMDCRVKPGNDWG
jgi:hypothetical protein